NGLLQILLVAVTHERAKTAAGGQTAHVQPEGPAAVDGRAQGRPVHESSDVAAETVKDGAAGDKTRDKPDSIPNTTGVPSSSVAKDSIELFVVGEVPKS